MSRHIWRWGLALGAICLLAWPDWSHAQVNRQFSSPGLGIFGGDSSGFGSTGSIGAFGNFAPPINNYLFGQSNFANVQQYAAARGAPVVPVFRAQSTLSPYLGLFRNTGAAVNYYQVVRQQADRSYRDWATDFRIAELQREQQLRAQQGYAGFRGGPEVDWSVAFKEAEKEGEKALRVQIGMQGEEEFGEWADAFKEKELAGETKMERERRRSKQRARDVATLQRLKQLEADIQAGGDRATPRPGLMTGLQTYHGPAFPPSFRQYQHYFPSGTTPQRRVTTFR